MNARMGIHQPQNRRKRKQTWLVVCLVTWRAQPLRLVCLPSLSLQKVKRHMPTTKAMFTLTSGHQKIGLFKEMSRKHREPGPGGNRKWQTGRKSYMAKSMTTCMFFPSSKNLFRWSLKIVPLFLKCRSFFNVEIFFWCFIPIVCFDKAILVAQEPL